MKNIPQFIAKYRKQVIDGCDGQGLFPSVCMAQMMLEGGGNKTQYGEFGLSQLAYKYNNYGGIKKWAGYTGKSVEFKTAEETPAGKVYYIYSYFCVFTDVTDFVKWRTIFLKRNARYAKAGVFDAKTPLQQITALKNAGYATDVKYVSKIMSIINQYKLTTLDDELKKKLLAVNNVLSPNVSPLWSNIFTRLFFPVDSTKNVQ